MMVNSEILNGGKFMIKRIRMSKKDSLIAYTSAIIGVIVVLTILIYYFFLR